MARPAPEIPILLSEQRCYFQNVEIFGANFNELVIGRPGARRPVIKAAYASRGGPRARDTSTCPSDYGAGSERPALS